MPEIGRALILAGTFLAFLGALVWLLGRAGWKGLPGDIVYETDHVKVYVPIVSCLVLSVLLTCLAWLFQHLD